METLHVLHQRHTHPEGLVSTHSSESTYPAADAIKERIRRFRDNKINFTREGNVITFTDHDGSVVELTYQDA